MTGTAVWNAAMRERSWPYHAHYFHSSCRHCKQPFEGEKRAPCCYACHTQRAEETIRAQQERDASWVEVKELFEDQDDFSEKHQPLSN